MPKTPPHAVSLSPAQDSEIASKAPGPDGKAMGKAETAQYIAEFTAELSYLAREAKLDLVVYLLDMAKMEAGRVVLEERRKR